MKWLKKLFGEKEYVMPSGNTVLQPWSKAPIIVAILIILGAISVKVTDFDLSVLAEKGNQFFIVLSRMVPPEWSYTSKVIEPLIDTIKMSFLGSFLGGVLAFPFAALAAKNINTHSVSRNIVRVIFSILRTFPALVIALIATAIVGIGTLAGTIAIAIFTFSIVCKMLYEQIETVDMKPFEAMESLGATRTESFMTSVVPQILPRYISICLYTLEMNVRHAAILGYVGAGGIGLLLNEKLAWRDYQEVGMLILLLFVAVMIIESLSRYFRERLG